MADASSILSAPQAGTPPAATPPAGTPPAGTPPPASSTPPAAGDWLAGFDPDVRDAITAKGYKSPAEVGRGWLSASKLVGVDPTQVVKLPGKDADAAAWDAVYTKLGRPEKADGYSVPEALKDDPLAGAFREEAHKAGLSSKQFETTLAWYTEQAAKVAEQQAAQAEEAQGKRLQALEAQVGPEKWPGYLEEARRAARVLIPESYKDPATGQTLTREDIQVKLAQGLGADLAVTLMANIAKFTVSEDSTERGRQGAGAGMSRDAAAARKAELRADRAWMTRWANGDADARKEMVKLDQIIAGAPPA